LITLKLNLQKTNTGSCLTSNTSEKTKTNITLSGTVQKSNQNIAETVAKINTHNTYTVKPALVTTSIKLVKPALVTTSIKLQSNLL